MLNLFFGTLRDLLRPRHDLLLQNLALRQQILVLQRTNPRPRFPDRDRAFWVLLSRWWAGWRRPLRLVQPETVIRWHPPELAEVLALEEPSRGSGQAAHPVGSH